MAGWVEGSNTSTYYDYGPAGTNYANLWTECQVDAWTSGDYLHYTFWIRCSSGYPHCYIHLNVSGTVIYDGYYAYDTFPGGGYGIDWRRRDGKVLIGSAANLGIEYGLNTSKNARTIDKSMGVSRVWWTDAQSSPSLSVTDNGNNTVTISGTNGVGGSYNGITSATLYWTTNGQWPSDIHSWTSRQNVVAPGGGNSFSKTLNISSDTDVRAIVWNTFERSSSLGSGNKQVNAKYYAPPGNPGKPIINHTKSRLTIKEPWTITWDAAPAGNSNTPIAGYRIRIYKNGVGIPIKNSAGATISTTIGPGNYPYDVSSCSFVLDPISNEFKAGDTIQISLYAFGKNNKGEIVWTANKIDYSLWSGEGENAVTSDVYTVQNAGVMRPLYNGKYVEGQVFACIPNGSGVKWVEADIVKVNANGTWKESE